ncbi:hypothetical protein [Psychrobacter sp.]|uniref:hypothetical protein n=1 Tax=Psychrobacter sp. TaxID=56811 RepID=UPI003F990AE4
MKLSLHRRLTVGAASFLVGVSISSGAYAMCAADTEVFGGSAITFDENVEIGVAPPQPANYWLDLDVDAFVQIKASHNAADPYLRLMNEDGAIIAANDDYDGLNAQIDTSEALEAGRYCLEVDDVNGGTDTISVTAVLIDETQVEMQAINMGKAFPSSRSGETVADAGVLRTKFTSNFYLIDEANWVVFDVEEPSLFDIRARSYEGVDTVLRVLDSEGRILEENDDYSDSENSRVIIELEPGTYAASATTYDDSEVFGETQLFIERFIKATE